MGVLLLRPGRRPMFPPLDQLRPGDNGLVGLGGDLRPETVIEAYSKGIFPWDGRQPIPWYSPDPRMVLPPSKLKVSRSLGKLARQGHLRVTLDTAFTQVMQCCAATPRPGQPGTWITPSMIATYTALHERGIAHSVEVWEAGALVGGLYGLAMGATFFGESMFHTRRDASKLALLHLCRRLEGWGFELIDCQQETPHLASLGAAPISRAQFTARLRASLAGPGRWGGC
ncbi:MAG: leucyl/phenylalanyl-tRNA--protein transferase [Myxococcota bacterium]|nr:leucyl/phenylalanyl-tRNA--protein transferase [Myxococcota bacterium]